MKPIVTTYRIQLNRHFTLRDLLARVDYLQALNVSHLYLSPIMESVSGSDHGYDVTDFAAVSRERGGEEGLRALDEKLRRLRMHMILDIVPNHMAACLENGYWRDVLMNGVQSDYWRFFDLRIGPREKIELPVLQDSPEALIASGGLFLDLEDADIVVDCAGNRYPVNAQTVIRLRESFEASREKSFADYLGRLSPAVVADVLKAQQYSFVESVKTSHAASYRRFFDITGLVALRMEDRQVFQTTHRKLFELARQLPSVAGVRVDHIDGLAKPGKYLEALSREIPLVWVEKILARDEALPGWSCSGTTGYEFIDRLNQVMTDDGGFRAIESHWQGVQPAWKNFDACARQSKEEVLESLFPADVERLAAMLAGRNRSASRLQTAIIALTAALPVYRVYSASAAIDRKWIRKAVEEMRGRKMSPEQSFVAKAAQQPQTGAQRLYFQEWQKLTGPAMAKGLEDRAHYRYTPLTGFNEVGCSPAPAQIGMQNFCSWLNQRQEDWPLALNAATTHDTKRSEDARHRLHALADRPGLWRKFADRALASLPRTRNIHPATVLFFLQAVLATWPLQGTIDAAYCDRIWVYMKKAAREAAMDTSWSWPDAAYEAALENFVRDSLTEKDFVKSVARFMQYLGPAGAVNSLAAQTVRMLSAGVPDIFQGMETWRFTLVDPDNRAPVDFDGHEFMLKHIETAADCDWRDGSIKMWLTRELLKIRRGFLRTTKADYDIACLRASGVLGDCLMAYMLQGDRKRLAVVTARQAGKLVRPGCGIDIGEADWGDTALHLPQASRPFDLLSGRLLDPGRELFPAQLFAHLPVAVLTL